MQHTLVKMTNPEGEVIEIAQTKVEKMLNRGWTMTKTKPSKATEPEMVQIENDSHEEIDYNKDNI